MSDLKLFRIKTREVEELPSQSVALEKSLQNLIEKNLEVFLGVEFLASEYSTGVKHGGRIDTLGIDENGCPVIIEYKRSINENVINQGLYYLDWLLDHQADFELLVIKKLGADKASEIEWSTPQLKCIAGDFKKYDEHAVEQINRNIELIRYRKYGDELILFELVNSTAAQSPEVSTSGSSGGKTFSEYLKSADQAQLDLFESIKAFCLALGDDVQYKVLKHYGAFKRLKNFCCVEVHIQTKKILLYLKLNPDSIVLEKNFTRDVRKIGHFGTGDLEVTIRSPEAFEKAKDLILQSYENS